MSSVINVRALRSQIADDLFGGPLIQNAWRGEWAERLVLAALGGGWRQVGGDWQSHDLERDDGLRVEVKQGAARQTWHTDGAPPSAPAFDIASRTGYYEGEVWHPVPGRRAHAYVFAWHPVTDATCDHTDPCQWVFYVVPASELPPQKTIGRGPLARLSPEHSVAGLPDALGRRDYSMLDGGQ